VLASQVATTTTAQQGATIADAWKTKYGAKMTGMVVINDDVAVGTLPARTGDFQPAVVSMNGEPAAVQAVQDGKMYADGGLENAVMGLSLAQVASDLSKGKKVPPTASSPYFLITKQTAAKFNSTFADATVLKGSGTTSFSGSGANTILKYKP
jgi:ABC-type sugar transport system substrate-binding protein